MNTMQQGRRREGWEGPIKSFIIMKLCSTYSIYVHSIISSNFTFLTPLIHTNNNVFTFKAHTILSYYYFYSTLLLSVSVLLSDLNTHSL